MHSVGSLSVPSLYARTYFSLPRAFVPRTPDNAETRLMSLLDEKLHAIDVDRRFLETWHVRIFLNEVPARSFPNWAKSDFNVSSSRNDSGSPGSRRTVIGWEPPVARDPRRHLVAIPEAQQRNWLYWPPGRGEVRRRPNLFCPPEYI